MGFISWCNVRSKVPDMKTVIQTSTAVAFTVIGWYVVARIIGTVATFFDGR